MSQLGEIDGIYPYPVGPVGIPAEVRWGILPETPGSFTIPKALHTKTNPKKPSGAVVSRTGHVRAQNVHVLASFLIGSEWFSLCWKQVIKGHHCRISSPAASLTNDILLSVLIPSLCDLIHPLPQSFST